MFRPALIATLLATAGVLAASSCPAAGFHDPLQTPAMISPIVTSSMLTAVTRTPGGRLVAVGRRGHIIVSDDGGKQWRQIPVPVSTDLVAVRFVDDKLGWAVGQGGIVLHSRDGGSSWLKQLDGRQAADLLIAHYEGQPAGEARDRALDDAKRFREEGPGRPFLDVWFDDGNSGFIVGAYNMVFRTTDGGKSWSPWSERVPNENGLHLNGIQVVGDTLYLVGEQGSLWRLDRQQQRFNKIATPYQGSYFGLTGKAGSLVLFGLRGHAFRSDDGGKQWQQIDTGCTSALAAGTVVDDRLILVGLGGEILSGPIKADRLQAIKAERPMPYYGVVVANNNLVLVGALGARQQKLQ